MAHNLAAAQRDLHTLGKRQVPDLVIVGVFKRERRERILNLARWRGLGIGVLDLGGDTQIMREVPVFPALERLLRGTPRGEHRGDEHQRPEFARLPIHAVAS